MSKVSVTKEKLDILANAIANKSGEPLTLTLDEMVSAVDGIDTSGITPTGNIDITQAGVTDVTNYATATVPNAGYASGVSYWYETENNQRKFVTVGQWNGIVGGFIKLDEYQEMLTPERKFNAIPTGTTVTPTTSSQTIGGADYMMEGAVTVSAMPTGTAGTPTATKDTVSNHSVSVTPSVTNTTGYITGSTKTGTAVTISASELVSGTLSITQNGIADVTNYASVDVNVSGGGGGSLQIDAISEQASMTTSSLTYTGLKGEPSSFAIMVDDGITPSAQPTVAAVVFDGISLHGQTITNTTNAQVSYDGLSFSKSYSNGTLTITSNGASFQSSPYFLVYSYGGGSVDTKDVQVGSGATSITFTGLEDEPTYWTCIFKSNFGTSSGYQRVIFIENDGTNTIGTAMDSSTHGSNSYWTASYSNGSLTITSQGTNAGGYFHQPGYYQLTYAYDDGSGGNYQTKSKTYTPTTSQQTETIQADVGYDALKKVNVTVNAIPSEYIIPTGNYPITQNGNNINVAQYETVSVNVSGGGSLTVATKTLTHTATSQTLSFSSLSGQPKYWFLRATTNVSSSGSTTYYYVTDCFYDGTNIKGNTFRIGSTRRVQDITSGITQSYSGGTLTITAGSSSGATPGQFYGATNFGYELVYVY